MCRKTSNCSILILMIICVSAVGCKKEEPILNDGSRSASSNDFPPPIIGEGRVRGGTRPRMMVVNPSITPMPNPRQNWSRFRDFDGAASSPYSDAPIKWTDERNIVWKAELAGRGASSPVVWKDRVFVTSYTGYSIDAIGDGSKNELQHHVICLDRNTGQQIWQRSIKASSAVQPMNKELMEHGYASSSPTTDGQNVFVFFGASGLYAFNMNGELAWKANVGHRTHHFGSSSSPIVFGNLVIVNASIESDAAYAFDKESGKAVWKIDDVDFSFSTPVIAQMDRRNFEMIVNHKHWVRGFDPFTGKELWRCKGIDDYVVPTPIVNGGIVYCSGGKERRIMAITLGGRGDVTETHKLWEKPLAANVSSPIFYEGHIYVINTGRVLECIKAEDGSLVKQVRTKANQQVYASPTRIGEHFLIPTIDKGVLVYEASPDLELMNVNEFEAVKNDFKASVVCSEHDILLRNDDFIYCIGSSPAPNDSVVASDAPEEIIEPPTHYDLGPDGKQKRYVQFMTNDAEKIIEIILMPYKSVITEEQKEASRKFVMDRIKKYQSLNTRYKEAYWTVLSSGVDADEKEFASALVQLEKEMNQLTGETRVDVKKLFSEEQMAQHLEEAKAWREKEANRLKRLQQQQSDDR